MQVTNTVLENLRVGFKTTFQVGLKAATSLSSAIRMRVPSSAGIETYGWLGDLPKFREWIGERRYKSIREEAYQLKNRKFEVTMGLPVDKIADDTLGIYAPIVEGWGQNAGNLEDELVFDALDQGHVRACFDGQNYFDDDHVTEDGTVWSNKTGNDAVAAWYLLDLSQPMKPILYQERQAPTFTMITDPNSETVFKNDEYLMGGKARAAAGYTFPQLAHRCTGTLNKANYEAAYKAMTSLKDSEGRPIGVRPTHIVYGSSNRAAAKALFSRELINGGDSNEYYKDVELIEAPRLA